MSILTRRVQVLFSPDQIARLKAIAQAKGESVGTLIRQAVEAVYFHPQPERRREAVKRMAALSLPVSDWEQMERESMPGCSVE
jgi:hypothetical protein